MITINYKYHRSKIKSKKIFMKNLIRKVFITSIGVLLFSCSNDNNETKTEEPAFFNLNIGNKWIYKKYENSTENPSQFTFSGIVDTIKIIGTVNAQGFTFAKKSSKKVNITTGKIISTSYSFLRVNNLGHLIEITDIENVKTLSETSGLVLHPGNDVNYTYNYDIVGGTENLGNVKFNLYSTVDVNVENNIYSVLPYNGIFTPLANHPELISKTIEMNYSKNIGLVKMVCHAVFGNYTWEERLVSYQLK